MNWREGLTYRERIDVALKAQNIEPTSEQAIAIARAEWSDYSLTTSGEERPLNDTELDLNARDTLADIVRERGRN